MLALVFTTVILACSGDSVSAPILSPAAARGKEVYAANCTACHNADPSKPGSLGPELRGSSRALIEARVLRAEYPVGYTPKRTSTMMTPLPAVEPDLDALAAYLQ